MYIIWGAERFIWSHSQIFFSQFSPLWFLCFSKRELLKSTDNSLTVFYQTLVSCCFSLVLELSYILDHVNISLFWNVLCNRDLSRKLSHVLPILVTDDAKQPKVLLMDPSVLPLTCSISWFHPSFRKSDGVKLSPSRKRYLTIQRMVEGWWREVGHIWLLMEKCRNSLHFLGK